MKAAQAMIAALLLAGVNGVVAQPLALPPPPAASLVQQVGVALPLPLKLQDDFGRTVQLADYFRAGRPVLLVLGYYRCAQLCGLLMQSLLQGLQQSGVPRSDWAIVGISIDPQDDPASAHARRASNLAFAASLAGPDGAAEAPQLDLLIAQPAAIELLTERLGYAYAANADADGDPARAWSHPATVVVASGEGRVSRYINGIDFEPAELRLALREAAGDRIGALSDRIALLCAHFDPRSGRYSAAVMGGLRAGGLLLVIGMAGWCWRRRGLPDGDGDGR